MGGEGGNLMWAFLGKSLHRVGFGCFIGSGSTHSLEILKSCPMGIRSYRDLTVWNTAVQLTLEVYHITESFPQSERFGLTSQLRRAAVSIPSNIAEGHARSTRGEYRNFLSAARGSTIEVEVQLYLAEQIGYVQSPVLIKARSYCDSISRMISGLKRTL